MIRYITFIVLLFAYAASSYAQGTVRSIILVNGEPFIADLTVNGSVVAKYQKVPDYFTNGLDDKAIIANAERQGLKSEGSIELYADNLDDAPIPALSEFRSISDDNIDSKQYVAFSRGRAILNRQSVDQIRAISDAYQTGQISEVVINAYHNDTEQSRILAKNRGKAISDLMTTFGMSPTSIQVNMPYGSESDQLYYVYLSFVQ